jgi:hypothetical protein
VNFPLLFCAVDPPHIFPASVTPSRLVRSPELTTVVIWKHMVLFRYPYWWEGLWKGWRWSSLLVVLSLLLCFMLSNCLGHRVPSSLGPLRTATGSLCIFFGGYLLLVGFHCCHWWACGLQGRWGEGRVAQGVCVYVCVCVLHGLQETPLCVYVVCVCVCVCVCVSHGSREVGSRTTQVLSELILQFSALFFVT